MTRLMTPEAIPPTREERPHARQAMFLMYLLWAGACLAFFSHNFPEESRRLDLILKRLPPQSEFNHPNWDTILLKIGRMLHKKKHYDEELQYLDRLLRRQPENAEALLLAGQAHLNRSRRAEAEVYFQRALRAAPDSPLVLLNLIRIAVSERRDAYARSLYKQLLSTEIRTTGAAQQRKQAIEAAERMLREEASK